MLDPQTLRMVPVDHGTDPDGHPLVACANRAQRCNWAASALSGSVDCFSCRITRRLPDRGDTAAMAKLVTTGQSLRRLLVGLADLHLPVVPYWLRDGGLAFDLLSSRSPGVGKVIIGHANGVVTIDLAESLDDHREAQRVRLGEPYRTMLGHFRHEVGHYYQWQLVEEVGGELLDRCRALFGDERVSYPDAIARHYATGAPKGWAESYLSEYATMHPWEDFAETFAHYQHILDTLTTVANGGLRLIPGPGSAISGAEVIPKSSYLDGAFSSALADWKSVSHLLNRANHAMGKGDLYPFRIPEPVVHKLEFVHEVVRGAGVDTPFVQSSGAPANR